MTDAPRDPIILPGFTRARQLDIPFQSKHFAAIWLRRTYTAEARRPHDDRTAPKVRYGNNVTTVLNACIALQQYYRTPHFWACIALKGSLQSEKLIAQMVDILVDARRSFRKNNPSMSDSIVTDATAAADEWIQFLDTKGHARDLPSPSLHSYEEVCTRAEAFFKQARGRSVDLAGITTYKPRHDSTSVDRKRSASPATLRRAPSPKRWQRSDGIEHPHSLPPRPPLGAVLTDFQIKGSAAKQEHQTPISATERFADESPSAVQGVSDRASETWRKIRGTAQRDKNVSPSIRGADFASCDGPSDIARSEENHRLRKQLAIAEGDLMHTQSQLFVDMMAKFAGLEKSMQARITDLEEAAEKSKTCQAHQAQQIIDAEHQMKLARDEIASLKDGLSSAKETAHKQEQRIEDIEGRFAPLSSVSADLKASDEARTAVELELRLLLQCLGQTVLSLMIAAKSQLENSELLEGSVGRIELRSDNGERIGELESEVATVTVRLDKFAKESEKKNYVTKGDVQEVLKQVEHRQTRESQAIAKQIHVERLQEQVEHIQYKLTTKDIQMKQITETIDALSTPKSPRPSPDMQWNMEEMQSKVNNLPTFSAVSEMILEGRQKSKTEAKAEIKTEMELLQRKIDDWKKTLLASTTASASDRIFPIEKNIRTELERLERDLTGIMRGTSKDTEIMRAQIKGINKLYNETLAGIAKPESIAALRGEMAALKSETATVSKRQDEMADQISDTSLKDTVTKLETRVAQLHIQVSYDKPIVTPADLSARLKELRSEIDNSRSESQGQGIEDVKLGLNALAGKVGVIASSLTRLLQHMT
ncbi:unnamed protein product [Discula destructiva]